MDDNISASDKGPCALVNKFSASINPKKNAKASPQNMPQKTNAEAADVTRKTITRLRV